VLACEDTRRTLILLNRFEIRRPAVTISYRQGNEERVGQQLLDYVAEGKTVAVCSDSGYPGISDPGYRLVRLAVEKGVPFEVIPGASAIPVALLLSGLPTSSYTFKGYPPRKPGPLRTFFDEEKDRPHTLILFESPHRVGTALQAAAEVLGDREAAVCVELTKKFERVHRGYLMELAARFEKEEVRGEVTIVVAGDNPKFLRPPLCPSHGDGQPE
jgi:16S rRNA (cytidine1402-2'-O)-methyltransferase